MAKLHGGRLDGVWGMTKFSFNDLHAIADEYEAKIKDPDNEDDPKWLQRRANKIGALARKKEKAVWHKLNQ